MKAVISYNNYCGIGRYYSIKLMYNDLGEAEKIREYVSLFENIKNIYCVKNNDIVKNIYVSKELLYLFIDILISEFDCSIMIGNYMIDKNCKFINDDMESINNYIDKLHTKATLNFGNYFSHENVYYVSFDYANDGDKDELLYYFNSELGNMMTNLSMWPYIVSTKDKNNKHNCKNYVRGTNIPRELLPYFIEKFINDYHMVVNIGDYKLRNKFNRTDLIMGLSQLENINNKDDNSCNNKIDMNNKENIRVRKKCEI